MCIKVCTTDRCFNYHKRHYGKFCSECGSRLWSIVRCCANEDLHDTGFCQYCGKKKEIAFANEQEAKHAHTVP